MRFLFLKNKKTILMLKVVASIIFIAILYNYAAKIDFKSVAAILGNVNFLFIALSVFIIFLNLFLKALRLKLLSNSKLKISDCYFIENVSIFLASITPGRIGDFSKIYFLKNGGVETNKSIVLYFSLRAMDVAVMVFYALIFYFLIIANINFVLFGILLLSAIIVAILIVLYLGNILILKKLRQYTRKSKIFGVLKIIDFHDKSKNIVKNYFAALMLSFAVWIFEGIFLFSLVMALNNFVPILDSVGILSLGSIAGLLTVLPFGLGPTDLAISQSLNFYGISNETIAALLILMRFIVLITLGLSSLMIIYIKNLNIAKIIKRSKVPIK